MTDNDLVSIAQIPHDFNLLILKDDYVIYHPELSG